MAYKEGVALAASVTLLLGSIALLSVYVACSAISCFAVQYSYGSPIWTGVLLLGTAFIGIFMSTTRSEKGCGCLFLILSIFGILATIACVGICLIAAFWEISLFSVSQRSTTLNLSPTHVTTTQATPTAEPVVGFSLWIVMAGLAFIASIVTCVTSCQYCCCCQERVVNEQTIVVYHHGGTNQPQNISVEHTNTIVTPQQGPQTVLLTNGLPVGTPFIQQPLPVQQVFTQPIAPQQQGYPPPPYAAVGPAPPLAPPYLAQNAPVGPPQPQPQLQHTAPPNSTLDRQEHQRVQAPCPTDNRTHHPQPSSSHRPRPVPAANNQAGPGYSTRINDTGPPPSVYQPLIQEAHQRGADIQHTYGGQSVGGSQINDGYIDVDARSATNIQHTYHHSPEPEACVKNAHGPLSQDIDSRLYEYIDDLSDEYEDTEVDPKSGAKPSASSEYVNNGIGRRPKAPNPKKPK